MNNSMLKLDDWINFCVDGEAAHLAFQLRQKWNATFLRRMRSPSKIWNPVSPKDQPVHVLYLRFWGKDFAYCYFAAF